MSRIRAFDSSPELKFQAALRRHGLRFLSNVQKMPGRPDVVFPKARVVIFVDGIFWHGYRYPAWKQRLSPYWQSKIERNRARDIRNHRKLRRLGWTVVRIWEHQVKRDAEECAIQVAALVRKNAKMAQKRAIKAA